MQSNFLAELQWRGMLHDMTPGLDQHLSAQPTTAYIGFDPTASSLHIGNLATIMLLKHFQLCGHKPIALVGGATGMIGDPSGKAAEREFLSEETLRYNQEAIKKQLENFLVFDNSPNAAEMVNNYDWFKEFTFLGFLREAGKFLTVNYMMAKDSVKKRLETGISFTEFSYQLLQGYDFYHLYKNKGVTLQMGGSDQWGNITTGTEIIRRKEGAAEEPSHRAFALTTPLVTKSDGTKFGKSEAGNVWLDPSLTSPFQFYQFWLNTADDLCPRLLRVFTLYTQEQILAIEAQHATAPHLRAMQKALAKDVTIRVHSLDWYQKVINASEVLYGKAPFEQLAQLSAADLSQVLLELPRTVLPKNIYLPETQLLDLLSVHTLGEIYASKGEARRALSGNAISINKTKVTEDQPVTNFTLLKDSYLLMAKGKKFHLLVFE
jgi:tyrosyl-tRNA synthetase